MSQWQNDSKQQLCWHCILAIYGTLRLPSETSPSLLSPALCSHLHLEVHDLQGNVQPKEAEVQDGADLELWEANETHVCQHSCEHAKVMSEARQAII